ncbi:hypothetical protein [Kytococcus sp. Marseille-QA3725]
MSRGFGRVLVAAYAVLALAATGRSVLQLVSYFDRAPLAYLLSTVAALIYLVATVAMVRGGAGGRRIALVAVSVEMVGVLAVGALSMLDPVLFPDETVWSDFGRQYGFVPLVLPAIGLWWLLRGADSTR